MTTATATDLRGVTIEWAENPLASRVLLDDYGRLRLRYGIAKDALSDAAALISLELEGQQQPREGRWIDRFEFSGVDDYDAKIEETVVWCERELQSVHDGDCTCTPMSCLKCHAEGLLGVDTLAGLGKHPGSHLQSAFRDDRMTLRASASLAAHGADPGELARLGSARAPLAAGA